VRLISTRMWRSAHLCEQGLGLVLVHDVDAVADAFGVTRGSTASRMLEAEAVGRNEAGGELARRGA